jgi:hypothetical protein
MIEKRVLRRIFKPKMGEVIETGENYITRSFMIYTPNPIFFG